jgi:integrase
MIDPFEILVTQDALTHAGQVANQVAANQRFADYRARKSANTRRAHDADLAVFAAYLNTIPGVKLTGDLAADPHLWQGVSWGIVAKFVEWMLAQGYAIGTINRRLSTVKKYAALAFQAGVIDAQEYGAIRLVTGYTYKEARHVDERRIEGGGANRIGAKKAESVSLQREDILRLKREQPDTPQGRRDALLMCLLLDHGLRCGEVAALKVENVDLSAGTMTFYRAKVGKTQTHRLSKDTRAALNAWVRHGDIPLASNAPLLRGSKKNGQLSRTRMSERAITKRVQILGALIGVPALSAHDCRHAWATSAARRKTDPFVLQEAGGWNSLAMPRRYIETAKIANEGLNLDDE